MKLGRPSSWKPLVGQLNPLKRYSIFQLAEWAGVRHSTIRKALRLMDVPYRLNIKNNRVRKEFLGHDIIEAVNRENNRS